MKIFKKRFSKSELNNIPEDERYFFLLIGHLANELNILQKLIIMCYKLPAKNKANERAHLSQVLTIVKILVGKVWEGWELIRKAFFATRLSREYDSLLSPEAREALKNLKRYFDSNNLVKNVRNEFSFHYNFDKIKSGFSAVPDNEELDIYLAETTGNSLFYASEVAINFSMLDMIDSCNHQHSFDKLFNETIKIVSWLVDFAVGCMNLITKRYYLALNYEPLDIGPVPTINDIEIPYFVSK
jgi:hypothetical protein